MTEHRNRELVFLILRFLEEQKYDDAVHRLEKDSGYFFNMRYFEDCVIHGEWDEVEHYLAGFTKVDENSDSTKILFAIRKQKFLEALDRHDHAKAVQILQRDLEPLLTFGDEFYDEVSSLFLPVVICREKERISKCDDARSTRAALLSKIKMLIDASPLFHDKLQFPNFDHSRLRTLLKQSYSDTSIYETVRSEVRRAISEIQNDLESAMRRSITPALATTDIADTPPDLVNPSAVELVLDIRREYAKKLEQATQRSITPALATTDIADIPPDLVNPSAVEFGLDIRREYAKKLEQSRERSRKLQSDLAVEEHRGQELSRILKEVLPDPKTSNVPKSRPGRKASIERRKMSKRLTEEAMSYFDECVSLSTFDSSDFSSPEDPPLNLVGFTTPVGKSISLLQASSTAAVTNNSNSCHNDKQGLIIENQYTDDRHGSGLMASSGPREPQISPNSANMPQDWKFSFAHKPTETLELQPDIMKYARHFEKGIEKDDTELQIVRSNYYDLGEYNLQAAAQSYMFDRVLYRNRIESGGILLCGNANSSPLSHFASFF